MATDKTLDGLLKELYEGKKTGALYVTIKETSEDLFRIYFRGGDIYHVRYGTAAGKDCVDILEYYTLASAAYYDGIEAPGGAKSPDLPVTKDIIAMVERMGKKVRLQ